MIPKLLSALGNVETETGVLCRAEKLCLCGPYSKVYNRAYAKQIDASGKKQ